jgi:two-component system response regulator AtoC
MSAAGTLLVVEDDSEMRHLLEEELAELDYDVLTAAGGAEALERLAGAEVDVVITDLMMPGMKGSELMAEVRARHPDVPVVMITAFGSIPSAVTAIKAGASFYVAKPFRIEYLQIAVENALRERRVQLEIRTLRRQLGDGQTRLVAESAAMRRATDLLSRAAAADVPVILRGESGTGKELMARTLHAESPRAAQPFVAINCAAIPETLLESQLFGHRRGSFTDAREDHRGLFLEADGGTLFLDEIGDMPAALQGKLLRVLQEDEIQPLGAPGPVPVDVRIVAATHRDLETLCAEGRFRRDLYYRLNVLAVSIPPLRERPEDLLPLVAHFLEKHGGRLGGRGRTFTPEALEAMRKHAWPGNVRELENVIERALVLGGGPALGIEDLPESLRLHAPFGGASRAARPLAEVEREHIQRTLRAAGGNKAVAARMLGLDRKTLYRKLAQYRIRHSS